MMPSCEKCWRDAGGNPEEYWRLIKFREEYNIICPPGEQAGEGATACPKCGRKAVHQYADVCMACGQKIERSR